MNASKSAWRASLVCGSSHKASDKIHYFGRGCFLIAAVFGISACASHTPLKSDQATSYQGLAASGENEMSIPPQPADFGRYRVAVIESVQVAPAVAKEISPEVCTEISGVLRDDINAQMRKKFDLKGDPTTEPVLRIKIRITRITEASPVINTVTSLAIGPLLNGALAVELEALDGNTGEQKAMLLWAGSGGLKEFFGNYSRTSHARTLAGRFAVDATAFISPLSKR